MASRLPPVEVRISMEQTRHQIVHYFGNASVEWREAVALAVDDAVARFDFRAEVEAQVGPLLRDAIRDSLRGAFDSLAWDEAMRKALVAHLLRELRPRDGTT